MRARCEQSGSTLVMSMIVLIVLMLLGVTSMVVSDTQYRLSGNLQMEDTAMNNTETAINAAETWLASVNNFNNAGFTTYNSGLTPHLYPPATVLDPLTMAWNDNSSLLVGNTDQRYLIQMMSVPIKTADSSQSFGEHSSSGCPKVISTFQITSRGASGRGALKFVQSYYRVVSLLCS